MRLGTIFLFSLLIASCSSVHFIKNDRLTQEELDGVNYALEKYYDTVIIVTQEYYHLNQKRILLKKNNYRKAGFRLWEKSIRFYFDRNNYLSVY